MLLFSPTLAWFYMIGTVLSGLQEQLINQGVPFNSVVIGYALFYFSIIISTIIGSHISERLDRKKFFTIWVLFGVFTTLLFIFSQGLTFFLISCVLAGSSFGIGFPSSLAFFADSTSIAERGRISGLIILLTYVVAITFIGITFVFRFELLNTIILCATLRALGFIGILIDPCKRVRGKERNWLNILRTQGFSLYFLSWLMFILADGIAILFEVWVIESTDLSYIQSVGELLSYFGIIVSSLISGFMSDIFGRKKTIIFGSTMLGLSYAFFAIIRSPESYMITMIIYGAAWGIIMVNYYLTVIGDFSASGSKERFYALGAVMPFISLISVNLFSHFFDFSVPETLVPSIISMVLFISVIPVLYAPETLPLDVMKKRKHHEHLKKIQRLIEEDSDV